MKTGTGTSVNLRLYNGNLILSTGSGAEYIIEPTAQGMEDIMSVLRVLNRKTAGVHTTQKLTPPPRGAEHLSTFAVRHFDVHGREIKPLEDL